MGSTPKGGNYPYVTARIRARKTLLLGEEEYPRLLQRDVHEIARSLEEGQYSEEIHDLAARYSGAQLIEQATQQQLANDFARILGWCKGEPEHLLGLYFERFIVDNLKTVLRGARTQASDDEIQSALIPAGLIEAHAWDAAIHAETFEDTIHALPPNPYTDLIEDDLETSLPQLENALDRAYYERLLDAVKPRNRANKAFLTFLRQEVDAVNLQLVFRVKHANTQLQPLVPGGKTITEDDARRLLNAEWDEIPTLLEGTPFGDALDPAIEAYQETRDLNTLTGAIEHAHIGEADQFSHTYPLSILPLIDYVLRKRWEVDRLRMIAFGKQNDLPRDEIEELITR